MTTKQLAPTEAMLLCEHGHDHIVGRYHQLHLIGSPCPWDGSPLRLVEDEPAPLSGRGAA